MKLLTLSILIALMFVGCKGKDSGNPIITIDTSLNVTKAYVSTIAYDTTWRQQFRDSVEATVKVLLIQYYKAGWMDASSGMIDFYNKDKFDNKNIMTIRNKDWRKMENQVNSK